MNPDEAWIGKALFVGTLILFIWVVDALLTAKGEGARRVRLVIGGAITLGIAAFIFAAAGPVGFIITLVVLGAIIWIIRGFNK